jgi:hypothetical protein
MLWGYTRKVMNNKFHPGDIVYHRQKDGQWSHNIYEIIDVDEEGRYTIYPFDTNRNLSGYFADESQLEMVMQSTRAQVPLHEDTPDNQRKRLGWFINAYFGGLRAEQDTPDEQP